MSVATDILSAAGLPTGQTQQQLIEAQIACEKPAGDPLQWNNPLNTTLNYGGSYAANFPGNPGVQVYPDYSTGIAATAATLRGSLQSNLYSALQSGDVQGFLNALPGWGTSPSCVGPLVGAAPSPTPSAQASVGANLGSLANPQGFLFLGAVVVGLLAIDGVLQDVL